MADRDAHRRVHGDFPRDVKADQAGRAHKSGSSEEGFLKEGDAVKNNLSLCKEEGESTDRAFCTEIITIGKIKQRKRKSFLKDTKKLIRKGLYPSGSNQEIKTREYLHRESSIQKDY